MHDRTNGNIFRKERILPIENDVLKFGKTCQRLLSYFFFELDTETI